MPRVFFSVLIVVSLHGSSPALAGTDPWRLQRAAGLPDRLTLTGQYRLRFENLDGQYRGGRDGGDQVLMLRTVVKAGVELRRIGFTAEVLDSREELADPGTPLGTGFVNPLELLQAYAEIPATDWFVSGSNGYLRGGRITMDVGTGGWWRATGSATPSTTLPASTGSGPVRTVP